MTIGFLLGAGVSGPPTTHHLTQLVLNGENVHRANEGSYFLSPTLFPGVRDQDGIARIRKLLAFLNRRANRFFEGA